MADDPNDRKEQADAITGNGSLNGPVPENPELAEQKLLYTELNDRFLRLAADFENYRKRAAREQERILQFANEQIAVDLLDVIDNLDRAARSDDSHIREGLVQIQKLCTSVLERHGITPIESYEKQFDPAVHEAIAHVPSEKSEGTVIDEVSRGYRMHDKVIRFAKVAVSKGNEIKSEE